MRRFKNRKKEQNTQIANLVQQIDRLKIKVSEQERLIEASHSDDLINLLEKQQEK